MSHDACADLVERGDPDRFLSAMTAPPSDRAALMVLYAFNLEVARAPWVTKEAMIAEMRLQWWLDVIEEIFEGKPPRKHEVVTPLAELVIDRGLDRAPLEAMIRARSFDIYPEPHADIDVFGGYLADTAGSLMWLSAQALGENPNMSAGIGTYGASAGLAALFRAVPALKNAQKAPLVDESPDAITALSDDALAVLRAVTIGEVTPSARAALRAAWMAKSILKTASREPLRVLKGGLELSEFERRAGLTFKTILNRF